jgi:UDP-glucose 4-epimerase
MNRTPKMSILVTGGLGFAGRHIVKTLMKEGQRVVSYNRDYSKSDSEQVTAVQGELVDIPRLVETMRAEQVSGIIHTAAMSHPEISVAVPITTFAANVTGTLHVLEAARMAGVNRFVNFSSECVYGDNPEPISEATAVRPKTPYAVTKVCTEQLCSVYAALYGVDAISLRITEIYGRGLRMPEVMNDMIKAAAAGKTFALEEGADQKFHFVHVEDVARAALLAVKAAGGDQRVVNISGGPQVRLADVREKVLAQLPQAVIELGPGPITGWDQQGPFDIAAANRLIGYQPSWSLHQGIADLIKYHEQCGLER